MERLKGSPMTFVPITVSPYEFHFTYHTHGLDEEDIGSLWRAAHGLVLLDLMPSVFSKIGMPWESFRNLKRSKRIHAVKQVARLLLCLYSHQMTLDMRLKMDPEFLLPPVPVPF